MKRKFLTLAACLFAVMAFAQQDFEDSRLFNIDWKEDSTEITTINDIINVQQELTSFTAKEKHFGKVWSYRGYFNISYNNSTLSPKEPILTGVPNLNGGYVPEFKTDWGVSLQRGRNYRLHKKAIANVAQFNIDYTWIDLNFNHFKAEGSKDLYDSSQKTTYKDDDSEVECYYTPWNLEKYEANYGMSIGPSLTLAPFTYINVPALHFLKFNIYYHIGYHVSVLYMINDKEADANQEGGDYKTMADNLKLDLGHGIINSFGVNMSWKAIGIGYEHRTGKLKYQSLTTSDFGKDKYDFNSTTNRVYIQIRM